MDIGLLLLRLVLGGLFAAHGTQKLFGWFDGHGPEGTGKMFEGLGYKPGMMWATVAGLTEVGGGLLFALGFFTPLAAAAIIGTMYNAARSAHAGKGPWITNGGWEYTLVCAASALAVVFIGPGVLSLDNAFGLGLAGFAWGIVALALGLGVGSLTDLYRRNAKSAPRLRSRDAEATA